MTLKATVYILLFLGMVNCATNHQPKVKTTKDALVRELQCPKDVLGTYKGNLSIYSSKGTETVPMAFKLDTTGIAGKYDYIITYWINNNPQKRAYSLIAKDKAHGEYIIDEYNGIVLDAKVFKNCIISIFEVNNNLLTTRLYFYNDYMRFETTFSPIDAKNKTQSNDTLNTSVYSYPIKTVQSAKLYKQ